MFESSIYVRIAEKNFTSENLEDEELEQRILAAYDNDIDLADEPRILADEIAMYGAGCIMVKESNGSLKFLHESDVDERAVINILPQMKVKNCQNRDLEVDER